MNLGNTYTENPAIGDQLDRYSFSLRGKPQGTQRTVNARIWIINILILMT